MARARPRAYGQLRHGLRGALGRRICGRGGGALGGGISAEPDERGSILPRGGFPSAPRHLLLGVPEPAAAGGPPLPRGLRRTAAPTAELRRGNGGAARDQTTGLASHRSERPAAHEALGGAHLAVLPVGLLPACGDGGRRRRPGAGCGGELSIRKGDAGDLCQRPRRGAGSAWEGAQGLPVRRDSQSAADMLVAGPSPWRSPG